MYVVGNKNGLIIGQVSKIMLQRVMMSAGGGVVVVGMGEYEGEEVREKREREKKKK